jgi:lipid-A-disaccharide synthase
LLLSILPFEKAWYEARVPSLRVEFVGHPLLERHSLSVAGADNRSKAQGSPPENLEGAPSSGKGLHPMVVLLPGSRKRELEFHWPVMSKALGIIQDRMPIRALAVLPSQDLAAWAEAQAPAGLALEIQTGALARGLAQADLAIASSGTVTLECALFRVPAVIIYKTSRLTYEIARRIIQVRHIAMPNLLAGESVYPELIQQDANPEKIAAEALRLLEDRGRQDWIRRKLDQIKTMLGPPGASASANAAEKILELVEAGGS